MLRPIPPSSPLPARASSAPVKSESACSGWRRSWLAAARKRDLAPLAASARRRASASPRARPYLRQVESASVVLVTFAFRRDAVAHPLDTSGLLVPRPEGRLMTACSFGSSKWPHWSLDPERVVLRASAGRHGDERALALDDDELAGANRCGHEASFLGVVALTSRR